MTLNDWLDMPLYEGRPEPLVRERLAELIYKNRGLRISGWGFLRGGGLYDEIGLDQDDALELLQLSGVIDGFRLAGEMDTEAVLGAAMEREWDKRRQVNLLGGE